MEYIVEPPAEAVVMGFAASCVEHVARKLDVPYRTVFDAKPVANFMTKLRVSIFLAKNILPKNL